MNKFLLIPVLVFFLACNTADKKKENTVWIGGQIINPTGNFVRIYKGEKLIDSIALDEHNFFIYKNDTLPEGLYTFTHKEFQVFYLKPGDSLMLRVNTLEFDESLTYTGKGAERNNLLMELFLINEEENKLMPAYYMLSPQDFNNKLDSLKNIRKHIYSLYNQNLKFDSKFDKIVQAGINYDYFSKKERYTAVNRNKNIKYPDKFYSYRDSIDLKSNELQWYFSYYRFLNRYFDNLAWEKSNTNKLPLNKNTYLLVSEKIKLIDSLVQNEDLKNSMIFNSTKHYLKYCASDKERDKIVNLFFKTNTNIQYKEQVLDLANQYKNIQYGKTIPNLFLTTIDTNFIDLHSIIKKPTAIYFWSTNAENHYREIHKRVKSYSKKFPQYDFIAINIDTNFSLWRNVVSNHTYNPLTEYQFKNLDEATKKLVISSLNKAFIVSEKGVIKQNNANLFSPTFEKLLSKY